MDITPCGKFIIKPIPLYVVRNNGGNQEVVPTLLVDLISCNLLDPETLEVVSHLHKEFEGSKVSLEFNIGAIGDMNGITLEPGTFHFIQDWKIPEDHALLTKEDSEQAQNLISSFLGNADPNNGVTASKFLQDQLFIGAYHFIHTTCGGSIPLPRLVPYICFNTLGFISDDITDNSVDLRDFQPDFLESMGSTVVPVLALEGKPVGDNLDCKNNNDCFPMRWELGKMCAKFRELVIAQAPPGEPDEAWEPVISAVIEYFEAAAYELDGWTDTDAPSAYLGMRETSVAYKPCDELILLAKGLILPLEFRRDPMYNYFRRLMTNITILTHDAYSLKKEIMKLEKNNYFLVCKRRGLDIRKVWNNVLDEMVPNFIKEIKIAANKLRQRWGGLDTIKNFDVEEVIKTHYDIYEGDCKFGFLSKRYGLMDPSITNVSAVMQVRGVE